ncbi:MAG: hypothetical protein DMG06_24515 [Acidobacteria bacterium]|nr:MAG: hypothetical protein DMG06_24515 [Acidobacteriota bacterium]
MKTKTLAIIYVLVTLLAIPPVSLAQVPNGANREWTAVMAVQLGDKLAVKLKDARSIEGKLSSVSETTLTLSRDNKATDLNRENVLRVYRVSGKSAKSSTLIGAGVGAAAGAAVGAATGGDAIVSRSEVTLVVAAVGAVVGALVGFAFGKNRQKRVLIYEARAQQ